MNFIFRSYPSHPWFPGWRLEPQGCGTAFRKESAGYFFQTLETVGQVRPETEEAEWSLQIPIPQNSTINLLANGFCGYLGHRKRSLAAEVLVPEPGILWGRCCGIPAPVLLTEAEVEEREGFQWLESDASPALLAIRGDRFCLVSKARAFADAAKIAEECLERDFEAALSAELDRREGATRLFEQMDHHDALTVISVETMMQALRPPEGNLPGVWSQSPEPGPPHANANELHVLALAWRHIDIATAEELVLSTLRTQGNSGAIPVVVSPHQTFSILEAPKPLIAKTAEKVWQVRRDPQFAATAVPLLRRHLQWLLHHFDPKRRGLHCWQNSKEPIDPETYGSELATADLSALLLSEIEALNRMRQTLPAYARESDWFQDEAAALALNLETQFWNETKGQFTNAVARGQIVEAPGFSALVPLLLEQLSATRKNRVLDEIRASGKLPDGQSVLSWRKSTVAGHSFPVLRQQLLLDILKTAAPNGTLLREFSQVSLRGLLEWHTLSLQEHGHLPIDAVTAAYVVNLQETHSYRYHAKGGVTGWFFKLFRKSRSDWFEVAIVLVCLFAILTVHTIYKQMNRPPPLPQLLINMNSAYADGDGQNALANGLAIIKYYPDQAGRARLVSGNLLLLSGHYAEAARLLEQVRKEYPDSPAAMVALGLAYQLQGEFEKADANYAEFCYLFENIFPDLVAEVQRCRYLIQEGFKKPPKWKEIYGYPCMHEL